MHSCSLLLYLEGLGNRATQDAGLLCCFLLWRQGVGVAPCCHLGLQKDGKFLPQAQQHHPQRKLKMRRRQSHCSLPAPGNAARAKRGLRQRGGKSLLSSSTIKEDSLK
eukprot:scaffold100223_cov17-Tisochrysis_lutea.AAC.1